MSAHLIPSSNIGEHEVIFGGTDQLASTIEYALKIYEAELFIVFSGCTSEIIGDDLAEVVARFADAPKPVLFVESAGFKGSNLYGHELLWDAIIEQYLKPRRRDNPAGNAAHPQQVNVFASLPYQNPYWLGDLRELEALLSRIGAQPNIIYGPGGGVEALDRIPDAALNLLISPWVSLGNVQNLEKAFGTPYLHYPALPIGPTETGAFLRSVADALGISPGIVDEAIAQEEAVYYYYIDRNGDELTKTRLLPARFITIADSLYALGLTRFLVNDMGLIPQIQVITDAAPPESHEAIRAAFDAVDWHHEVLVEFANGSGEAQDIIRERGIISSAYILGSGWERSFALERGTLLLPVATPILERLVLNRTYVGYRGALTLLEDLCSPNLSRFQ
jgi:nitrogenase molybdenum-iron protein beta chain